MVSFFRPSFIFFWTFFNFLTNFIFVMGTYIYSLRSPKLIKTVELEDGQKVTVGLYAYEYKPISYGFFHKEPRWQILAKARITRMQNIWNKFINGGGNWPQAGVVAFGEVNEIKKGDQIIKWNYSSLPICIEDCTWNNGTIIGKVKEVCS